MSPPVTHEQWQATIIEGAKVLGWKVLHVRKSIGRGKRWTTSTNIVGWPDLFCFHPRHGFAAIEVKVGKDKPTTEQTEVLTWLAAAGATTLVAYPSDWDAVQALLKGQPIHQHPGVPA